MPKLGMNLLLWTTDMEDQVIEILRLLKNIGYDGVEVPVFDLNPNKWKAWATKMDDLGLERVAVTFCTSEFNPIDPDKQARRKAIERNKQAVECAALLGSELLNGPLHSALGVFTGSAATREEWEWAVEGMKEVAEYAAQNNVTLGIEFLNRFENYLLTCADDTVHFVRSVNHSNCKIMFDTFHANIEEKSVALGIRQCGSNNIHIQISENDRSTPGKGHLEWDEIFKALAESSYKGWLSIEAFGPKPKNLAEAAHIYRPMFASEEQLARDGFEFLRKMRSKYFDK